MIRADHYRVAWSTEHNSGELPDEYVGLETALKAGREWEAQMATLDDLVDEAGREYQWEVIRVDPPIYNPRYEEKPMSMTDKIDRIIADLQTARADAEKCDGGKAGAPGTRLRKAASQASKDLAELRKDVLAARG